MLSLENDYSCTATPEIIERISEIAQNQYPGYGNDSICESAKAKIREACACPDAQIFFLVGGTQTNQTIIDSITPQYAGVIAASTGHVNVHEAGAIEFTGHKVLTLPHHDGKIDATELDEYCATFYADGNYTHMVFPGCVYISQATEYGTLYTLAELEAIRKVCTKYDMPLFIDGARLGYALTATGNDVTLEDIARIADVFYIGGTKVGAMFGEAVVFTHGNMPKNSSTPANNMARCSPRDGCWACSSTRCSPTICIAGSPATPTMRPTVFAKCWWNVAIRSPSTRRPIRSSSRSTTRHPSVCSAMCASASWKRPTTRTR